MDFFENLIANFPKVQMNRMTQFAVSKFIFHYDFPIDSKNQNN
jgi:hypothetical protein